MVFSLGRSIDARFSILYTVCLHIFLCFSGYDMSTYIRRYSKYLNEKAVSYRSMAFDFCKIRRGYVWHSLLLHLFCSLHVMWFGGVVMVVIVWHLISVKLDEGNFDILYYYMSVILLAFFKTTPTFFWGGNMCHFFRCISIRCWANIIRDLYTGIYYITPTSKCSLFFSYIYI